MGTSAQSSAGSVVVDVEVVVSVIVVGVAGGSVVLDVEMIVDVVVVARAGGSVVVDVELVVVVDVVVVSPPATSTVTLSMAQDSSGPPCQKLAELPETARTRQAIVTESALCGMSVKAGSTDRSYARSCW